MNNLQNTFHFNQHELTVLTRSDGQAWFVAKEICQSLELSNTAQATAALKDDEKGIITMDTLGGSQETLIINESGMYALVFKSRKAKAEEFRVWVTSKVLPEIRKTGSYSIEKKDNIQILAEAVLVANEELQKAKPKIEFYDRVAVSNSTHSMSEVAKVLKLSYGRNKLYRELRKMGVLMRNNEPYQQYIDRGYFKVKLSEYQRGDETYTSTTTIVTGSGLEWLAKKLEVN